MSKKKLNIPVLGILVIILLVGLTVIFSEEGGSQGYRLNLGEDFNTALAMRDDLGISLVLAVDVSGSMGEAPAAGGEPKYFQATSALNQVMDVLDRLAAGSPKEQVIKVGMVKFSDEVTTVLPLTPVSRKSLARIRALAANPETWVPGGATAIGSAVEAGVSMLTQSGTILKSLIVVTDGQNTDGPEPSEVLKAVYENQNDRTTPEFPVFTNSTLVSFIGFDIGSGYFDPLKDYGARVTSAADQAQLTSTLSGLLEADITKLEAPALGEQP